MRKVVITRTHQGYVVEYMLGEITIHTETISADDIKPVSVAGMSTLMPAFPINKFPKIRSFIS